MGDAPAFNWGLLPNLASSLVLAWAFLHVWRLYRERYLLLWLGAALAWVARYAWGIVVPGLPGGADQWLWVIPFVTLIRGSFFVAGGAVMTGRLVPRWWWMAVAVAAIWLLATGDSVPRELNYLPVYLTFAAGALWVGVLLGRHTPFPRFERQLVAWSLVLYGLLQLTFPWAPTLLAPLAPLAFLLSSLFQLTLALGVVMVYFRSLEAALGEAHARLAVALTRALSGHLEVCEYCHSVPEGGDRWVSLEAHLGDRTGASFSHGICPDCLERHYGSILQ